MNQLTITILPCSGDRLHREGVRVLRGQWGGKVEDQADVIVWRKGDQPWFPHVLGATSDLGDLPIGKVFMAMAAEAQLPDEELRRRLYAVCEGLGVDRARMMATGLSPEEAGLQRAVLAILSSNPDIVIFSGPDEQRLALLRRLAEDYAPVPKTFWLLNDLSGDEPVDFRWQAHTESVSSPLLESPPMGSVATGSMPRGLEVAQPGLTVLTPAELSPALGKELSKGLGEVLDNVSADAALVHITGTGTSATGDERITYDLSAAVDSDATGEVVVWVATRQPVQLIWGCLSRHRRPPLAKVTLVVGEGADAAWLAMAASTDGAMGLTARVGHAACLTITHASPAGLPPCFEQRLDLAPEAKVTLYSLAFCEPCWNQGRDQSSEKSTALAQASRQRAGVEAHRVRLAFGPPSSLPRSNQDAEAVVHAWAAYALLQSVQVEDPCTSLLNCAVPWLDAQLPMEYRVDLVTLLDRLLRRP